MIAVFARTKAATILFGSAYTLARRLQKEGITKFIFSRDDYPSTLRSYLSQAKHSIDVVSVSLTHKEDEGELTGLFRQRLAQDSNFLIRISLLAPRSMAAELASTSLNIDLADLRGEIQRMLGKLSQLKESLQADQQRRLHILVHESLPMGSAILLDASSISGTIQVETKLHRAPRTESFGFEVKGPGPFYGRQYATWNVLLRESRPVRTEDFT